MFFFSTVVYFSTKRFQDFIMYILLSISHSSKRSSHFLSFTILKLGRDSNLSIFFIRGLFSMEFSFNDLRLFTSFLGRDFLILSLKLSKGLKLSKIFIFFIFLSLIK